MNQQVVEASADGTARLVEENERLRSENERLRGMLGLPAGGLPEPQVETARLFPESDPLPQVHGRSPAQEKIALFRALFRGREDVYARYWCDERSGKKGYSPAARGRSGRGAKDYLPLTDEVLYRHLAGEDVVGLYPLLPDDTCHLLACDFDGPTWAGDALGFLEAADRWRVPAYLERSRSGHGGHVWVFFTRPVLAVQARRLGSGLLRETMVARGELELTSYDRLFPNQDFMPKGGFGNLIALPLQKRARARGNTEFVDRELQPGPDPWRALSQVRRLSPASLEALLDELPPVQVGSEGSMPTSRWGRAVPEPPAPESIRCVRGARLSLERSGLPPSLLARIKHLACLHNPEFHKRQKLRLSVYGTPRFVRCYEEDLTHLHLPRGILGPLEAAVREADSRLEVEEARTTQGRIVLDLAESLSPSQDAAVRELLRHDEGVLVAPPGSGKTRMACAVIAARSVPTLVLVHRKPLLDQWRLELQRCLGLSSKQIGQFGGGRRRRSRVVDLAMIQSIQPDAASDVFADYGQVVVDECHHVPAVSFEGIVRKAAARFILGLTATPFRRDGLGELITMRCGPIRHRLEEGAAADSMERRLIVRVTDFDPKLGDDARIQELYRGLVEDEGRNRRICEDVRKAVAGGRNCLVLTEWREHLDHLAEVLHSAGAPTVVLHGGVNKKERLSRVAKLNGARPQDPVLVLATGALVGEGFDLPRLDTLVMAFPISFRGKVIQYTGRILRSHPDKTAVTVFDYRDALVPVLARMQSRRKKTLQEVGFVVDTEGGWSSLSMRGDSIGQGSWMDGGPW
ncbi:MAG TPA: DEAD/DEAH box helicase family protein [Longimicrobiales bacterium]|nr:DEAD/DEAH box helicase family protein [Longimicrobiales bacterium]